MYLRAGQPPNQAVSKDTFLGNSECLRLDQCPIRTRNLGSWECLSDAYRESARRLCATASTAYNASRQIGLRSRRYLQRLDAHTVPELLLGPAGGMRVVHCLLYCRSQVLQGSTL